MKDFNIAKYLKEHSLGSHGILGKYVDLHGLKEDKDLGQQDAMPEPYEGPEDPIDGLGGELDRDMDVSMNEVDEEENIWMHDVDGMEEYAVGEWKCYWDHPGYLVWSYSDIPFSQLMVKATPGYESNGTPLELHYNDDIVARGLINEKNFDSFTEYAQAIKPYLDQIESNYEYPGNLNLESLLEGGLWKEEKEEFNEIEGSWSEEQDKYDRMMGFVDQTLESQLSKIKRAVDAARDRGLKDSSIFNMLATNSLTQGTVERMSDDGFDPQDIVDFFATDFN